MKKNLTKQYIATATSSKYGDATIIFTLSFDNESNTSTLTVDDNFVMGGQSTGYTADGVQRANSVTNDKIIKLFSLKALTKLGTNHLYVYKKGEDVFNKQTRFVCDLTTLAITIKNDIYKWRKTLENE